LWWGKRTAAIQRGKELNPGLYSRGKDPAITLFRTCFSLRRRIRLKF